jgi:hypothetical protein
MVLRHRQMASRPAPRWIVAHQSAMAKGSDDADGRQHMHLEQSGSKKGLASVLQVFQDPSCNSRLLALAIGQVCTRSSGTCMLEMRRWTWQGFEPGHGCQEQLSTSPGTSALHFAFNALTTTDAV